VKELFQKLKSYLNKKLYNAEKCIEVHELKSPVLTDMTAINYFRNKKGIELINTPISKENACIYIKKLVPEQRLKVLYEYMKEKSNGGLYKKETNTEIGKHFNCNRNIIADLLKELENTKRIFKLNELDKYYKLKEEF
jgi:hypothetical protein